MSKKSMVLSSFILMLTLTGGLIAQGVDPGTTNLKHSWKFDDGTANDYVGGANGTLVGGAEVVDGALVTSVQGQWMDMPGDAIAMNEYGAVTIAAWYMPEQAANTGYTMLAYFGDTVNGAGADGYFITSARGDDKSRTAITCGVYTNPWSGESGADGPEYDDGNLHHMVSTLSGDTIALYIDGERTGAAPLSGSNSIGGISPNFAYLAKSGYDADPQWIGQILEFSIYDRALTADEVYYLSLQYPSSAVHGKGAAALPKECVLLQNYPNPFNPTTNIFFDLPKKTGVRISVYDVSGREVARLVDGTKPAGRYTVPFSGENLGSGVYVCRMDIGKQVFTRRMTLLK
jgi:hypothetical protein